MCSYIITVVGECKITCNCLLKLKAHYGRALLRSCCLKSTRTFRISFATMIVLCFRFYYAITSTRRSYILVLFANSEASSVASSIHCVT